MNLVDELRTVVARLEQAGVDYALCGGVAVTIHGFVRATRDIDLLVAEADVERVLDLLRPEGWRFPAIPMTFDRGTPKERVVQRVSKIQGAQVLVLDLLVVGPPFRAAWQGRERVELTDGALWVVSRQGLAQMKRLAGRAQDLADLEHLERLGPSEAAGEE